MRLCSFGIKYLLGNNTIASLFFVESISNVVDIAIRVKDLQYWLISYEMPALHETKACEIFEHSALGFLQ